MSKIQPDQKDLYVKKGEEVAENHTNTLIQNGEQVHNVTASQLTECFVDPKGSAGEKVMTIL